MLTHPSTRLESEQGNRSFLVLVKSNLAVTGFALLALRR